MVIVRMGEFVTLPETFTCARYLMGISNEVAAATIFHVPALVVLVMK